MNNSTLPSSIPLNSDPIFLFEGLDSTVGDPVDLDNLDDVIVSIAKDRPENSVAIVKYSESPEVFSIDSALRKITVQLTSEQAAFEKSDFFVNLWLVVDGRYMTHKIIKYRVLESVPFDTGS